MPQDKRTLTPGRVDENGRVYPMDSDHPLLDLLHRGRQHADTDPYFLTWGTHDVARCTGLSLRAVNNINFKFYRYDPARGEKVWAPITIYRRIAWSAKKANLSPMAYIAAQNAAASGRNKKAPAGIAAPATTTPALDCALSIIKKLTRKHPDIQERCRAMLAEHGVTL